jgi:predicted ATP-grasp superfamily ATP-dependent carboligase
VKSNQPYLIHKKPSFKNGSFIIAWCDDAGDLGCSIGEYLLEKLDMYEFADIDLSFFFSLRGVSVVNNVAQFPRSSIYCCDDKKMAILLSSAPKANWYEFLSSVLDIAQTTLDVKSIYTIGGMISLSAHNLPPDMLMSANSSSFKNDLLKYGLTRSKDYETPPGQRPTLNSYLMWLAQKRGIVAANLWVPISFYRSTPSIRAQSKKSNRHSIDKAA